MTNGQSGFTLGIVKASPIDPIVADRSFSFWGKLIELRIDVFVLLECSPIERLASPLRYMPIPAGLMTEEARSAPSEPYAPPIPVVLIEPRDSVKL